MALTILVSEQYFGGKEARMAHLAALQEQRRQLHLGAARAAWRIIHAQLAAEGIRHKLFGSLSTGDFREHLDIDLMIL
ncbi:hypothetical protein [Cribrihabitans pelagius]|uniref:hypothetical protein n=1 Tax=Cribrihabitans pelagius TaxID=1765746 RepID=UPI003B5B26FD